MPQFSVSISVTVLTNFLYSPASFSNISITASDSGTKNNTHIFIQSVRDPGHHGLNHSVWAICIREILYRGTGTKHITWSHWRHCQYNHRPGRQRRCTGAARRWRASRTTSNRQRCRSWTMLSRAFCRPRPVGCAWPQAGCRPSPVLPCPVVHSWPKQITCWWQHFRLEDAWDVLHSINGTINYLNLAHTSHSHAAPYHDTHRVLDGGCCALGNVVLTWSSSHVPHTVTTEYRDFSFITPENFLPVICCPLEMFFCPGETFLVLFLIQVWPISKYPGLESSTDKSSANSSIRHVDIGILEYGVGLICCWLSVSQGQSDYPAVCLFTCTLLSTSSFCSCYSIWPFKSLGQLANAERSRTTANLVRRLYPQNAM